MRSMTAIPLVTAEAILVAAAQPASAESAEEFFKKTNDITLTLSAGPGGGYSSYGRAFARYFGNHMPGHPNIIVQNMPGGGGLRATNFLFNNAPKDGSMLGLIHSSVPLAPLYGMKAAKFDATKFNWIGSMNTANGICVAWHESPIKTYKDLFDKTFIVGGTGAGSQMETLPAMLNALLGTKNKIISGYKGGNDVYLAMERGEVHGRCGGLKSSIRSTRPEWFPKKLVNVVIQISAERDPDFPDVPTVMELIGNDEFKKKILHLVLAPMEMDRPVLAPPGVPDDRVKMLRDAFAATMKDKGFVAEAEKQHLELEWFGGDKLDKIIKSAYAISPDVAHAAAEALKPKASDRSLKEGAKENGGKKGKGGSD
jgi:tripartite-type tricarboxylate transporter receptor subunit TctC